MAVELMSGFVILIAVIVCIIFYLLLVNALKLILSVHFISRMVKDFKKLNKEYEDDTASHIRSWGPWKY